MIKCSYCGCDNLESAVYCMHCSKKLADVKGFDDKINHLSDVYYSYINNNYNHAHLQKDDSNNNYFMTNRETTLFISMILAMIIPGTGLIYLKRVIVGLFIFLTTILLWMLTGILYYTFDVNVAAIMLALSVILYIFSIAYTYYVVSK